MFILTYGPDNPTPGVSVKCAICKKAKGLHKAGDLHCPIGSKTKVGYVQFAYTTYAPTPETRKRDTIKSLAQEIQKKWPDLVVEVRRGWSSTDRKVGRLRHPGKGRTGMRIVVRNEAGNTLLDHDQSKTYKQTSDVRQWMERYAWEVRFLNRLRKRKKLTYTEFNKTVSVGDVLTVKWADGVTEKMKVASFSAVSNQPISEDDRLIFLEYVVW